MDNKILPIMLGIGVSLLMIGNFLMPIINDTVDETRGYYNNDMGTYAKATDAVSIVYDDTGYNVDGTVVNVGLYDRLIMSDQFYIERNGEATGYVVLYADGVLYRDTATDITITYSNNEVAISYTAGSNTRTATITIDWMYYVDDEGDYRMSAVDNGRKPTVFLNNINDLTVVYRTTTDLLTFHNGVAKIAGTTEGVELSVDYTLTKIDGVEDVYSIELSPTLEESEFKFILGENSYTASAVLVPYEVFGSKDGMGSASGMLYLIPLMIIVAILATIVAVIRSRD